MNPRMHANPGTSRGRSAGGRLGVRPPQSLLLLLLALLLLP